jgi:hypothetical protein
MSKEDTVAEINRQLAEGKWPSAMIAYLRILEKRMREHGF